MKAIQNTLNRPEYLGLLSFLSKNCIDKQVEDSETLNYLRHLGTFSNKCLKLSKHAHLFLQAVRLDIPFRSLAALLTPYFRKKIRKKLQPEIIPSFEKKRRLYIFCSIITSTRFYKHSEWCRHCQDSGHAHCNRLSPRFRPTQRIGCWNS